jgi:hypothetical protein
MRLRGGRHLTMLYAVGALLGWLLLGLGTIAVLALTVFQYLLLAETRGVSSLRKMDPGMHIRSLLRPDLLNLSKEGQHYLRCRLISLMIGAFCFPVGTMLHASFP